MGYKDIRAGTYKAKAIDGAFGKSAKSGTPQVQVRFTFMQDDKEEKIIHTMFLTEKSLPYTTENLARLGFDETKPSEVFADGSEYFLLPEKEVEIVIEDDPYEGKSQMKVKFINEIGGGQMKGMGVKQVLGNVDLRTEMAAARARIGTPKPSASTKMNEAMPEFKSGVTPF